MKKIELTIEKIERNDIPEVNNILTAEQATIVANYFNESDDTDEYNKSHFINKSYIQASKFINNEGVEDIEVSLETLQHIVMLFHSDKYEALY